MDRVNRPGASGSDDGQRAPGLADQKVVRHPSAPRFTARSAHATSRASRRVATRQLWSKGAAAQVDRQAALADPELLARGQQQRLRLMAS